MKCKILCLFFAVLLVKSSTSTNNDKEDNNGTADAPQQTETGPSLMSTLGNALNSSLSIVTTILALQSPLISAVGSPLSSSSDGTMLQRQKFAPNSFEQMPVPMANNELQRAHSYVDRSKTPKIDEKPNVLTKSTDYSKRKLRTNSAPAARFNPNLPLIDPRFYPQALRGDVTDDYNGTIVHDYYRALEQLNSSATTDFVRQLNSISQPYLEASPVRQKMSKTLTKLWDYEEVYTPMFYGGYYYYYRNSGLQKQSVLYQTKSLNETGKVFLDPNTFSKDGTVAVNTESFSNDGTLLAYGISEKGSDAYTVKFKRSTGEELKGQIPDLRDSELSWLSDGTGLFYSKKKEGSASLYFHKIRITEDMEEDILVVDGSELALDSSLIYGIVSEDGRFLFVLLIDGGSNTQMYYHKLMDANNETIKITGKLKLTPLIDQFDADYELIDSDEDTVLVYTNKDAPMYKLVRLSLNGKKFTEQTPQVVIPEDPKRAMQFVFPMDGNKLLIGYLQNVQNVLYVYDLQSGKMLYPIELPIGSIVAQNEKDSIFACKSCSKLIFKIESFLSPFTIYEADFAQFGEDPVKLTVFRQGKVHGLGTDAFTVKQEFYASKDKTQVPMFIIHSEGMVLDGTSPVFLTGYGGFDVSELPSFSVDYLMFIKHFGGAVAIPNIRGGSEFGEKWHEEGMREKKQNVFDDFIAAAEFLIRKNYTNSKKLAIYGASNGGLLTAVCSQQRPDLFGAVITQDAVLDMLRFNKMTIGAYWMSEYGNPNDPRDFPFLYNYSPLHQLNDESVQQWPATLLITADHDDRVDPAHTFKYAAELYYLLAKKNQDSNNRPPDPNSVSANPVLVKVQVDQGHQITGTPTEKVINEKVDIFSFIQRVLRLEWID